MHEKFGTETEGILREHIIKGDVKYNVVTMGILKQKWDTSRENFKYEKITIE